MTSVAAIEGLMQPETAFWILSALAQSAAALAGLSAVAWAFLLRTLREDIKDFTKEWGEFGPGWTFKTRTLGRFPIPNRVATIIIGYLLASFLSLVTLALVNPGPDPVPVVVVTLLVVAMGLAAIASLILVGVLSNVWPFFESLVTVEDARKEE